MSRKVIKRWVQYYGGIRLCDIGPQGEYHYAPGGIGTCSMRNDPILTDEEREQIGWATAEEAVKAIGDRLFQEAKELHIVAAYFARNAGVVKATACELESRAYNIEKTVVR